MPARYHRFLTPIVIIALTLLYLGIRLIDLDRLVTTDEPFWLGRSGNFYRALATGNFEHTYQMAHPGVMTMWAGMFGYLVQFPGYADLATGNLLVPYGIESQLRSYGKHPLDLMVAAKISKIIMQSIFFAISMTLLLKLLSREVVLVAAVLLIFSPILTGFDSALHVDGLFTIISVAAVTAVCWASFGRQDPMQCA